MVALSTVKNPDRSAHPMQGSKTTSCWTLTTQDTGVVAITSASTHRKKSQKDQECGQSHPLRRGMAETTYVNDHSTPPWNTDTLLMQPTLQTPGGV